MARYWYAQVHEYDVCFTNDVCTLYRFESQRERDSFVWDRRADEACYGNIRTESATRDEARHSFPDAFRVNMNDFYNDARSWEPCDDSGEIWYPERHF